LIHNPPRAKAPQSLKTDSTIKMQRLLATCVRVAAVALLVVASEAAVAQGGPPLVTDDPETPGDGHWEINLATIASHTSGRWEIAAPMRISIMLGRALPAQVGSPMELCP
jgi:hypothetical protein